MNPQLDAELVKNHPHLFADRFGDLRSTAMCWGFECGDGWYELLKEAADKLEPLCKAWFDKYKRQEKHWYKPVRRAIGFTAKVGPIFTGLYTVTNWLFPNMWSNPIYYYGGGPRASQVKEKYGTLRFYMTIQTDEMDPIITIAEKRSAVTCEQCGKKGKLRGRGWYYTACAKHTKKEDK